LKINNNYKQENRNLGESYKQMLQSSIVLQASGRDNSQTSMKSWMKKKKDYNNNNYSIRIN
jgi:hypothetical protein